LIDCRSRARNLGPDLCPAQNGADPASRKLESLSEVGPVLFLKIKVIACLPFATNKPQQMPWRAAIRS
jgi:hypothetical protein